MILISPKTEKVRKIRNELESITAELSYNENDTIRFESSHIQGLQIIKNRKIELEELEDLFKKKESYDQLKPKIDQTDKLFISIDTDIKEKTNNLEMARDKRRGIRLDFQNARIKLIDLKNNRDQLIFKIDSSNETLIELKNRQIDIKRELKES